MDQENTELTWMQTFYNSRGVDIVSSTQNTDEVRVQIFYADLPRSIHHSAEYSKLKDNDQTIV